MSDSVERAEKGKQLLAIAREELEASFRLRMRRSVESEPWLEELAATFVTLTKGGELRGCIGSLVPRRSLIDDVRGNACAAAFEDPRFPALVRSELDEIEIELSVLSPAEPLPCVDEDDLLSKLRPGIDGLVIECGFNRATFLPQVWRKLGKPRDFVRQLKKKAGLDPDLWPEDLRVSRYIVEEWREERS